MLGVHKSESEDVLINDQGWTHRANPCDEGCFNNNTKVILTRWLNWSFQFLR